MADTRTTESSVRAIISTSLTSAQVLAFIADANVWVTEEIVTVGGVSDARLEIIERYLSCALIRLRDLGLSSATMDDVSEKYQVDPEVTDYLLRAASMDPTGKVRAHFVDGKAGTKRPRFRRGTTFVEESDNA